MKKVVSITIGGVVFSIEEDAFTTLSGYLNTIREHFQHHDEHDEIVDDIEHGIAEKFSRKNKKQTVIRMKDVEAIIAEMGTVEDFKKELNEETDATEQDSAEEVLEGKKKRKKLYRNIDDRILAGVASGIAAYFGVDPVFIRIVFILLLFLNGFGILLYIILWIIMPAAKTLPQKLEMQGDPVTLERLERLARDKLPLHAEETASTVTSVLRIPFAFLRSVMNGVRTFFHGTGSVVRTLIGFVVFVGSGIGVIAASFGITGLHFTINAGLFEMPVRDLLTSGEYALGLASVYLLVLIPGTIGIMLGWALLKRSNKLTVPLAGACALLWIGALFGAGHVASVAVPMYQAYLTNMPVVVQEHSLDEFSGVAVYSGDNVTIQKGDTYTIEISGKEASVESRTFAVHNGVLRVHNAQEVRVCIGCFNPEVDIVITTPSLESLTATHGTHIVTEQFETESFTIDLRHRAQGVVDIIAERGEVHLAHGAQLRLGGSVDALTAKGYYTSKLYTTELENEKTSIELLYTSNANIGETQTLTIIAKHNSDVRYEGDPRLTEDISASSDARPTF